MRILTVLALLVALFTLGCGNPATPANNSDVEGFFAGVSPNPTGVIGDYTFTANDGSIETGNLVRGEDGQLSMQSDRDASVYSNFWFDILVNYDPADVRYYTGMGLPVYYFGDTFDYEIDITYKRALPLNLPGFLSATLTSEQRYWPGGGLLPGASTQVWNPFYIAPFEHVVVPDNFTRDNPWQ
jgi:hypothetical protein